MKDFSRPQFRLSNSSVEVRSVYTGFLIFAFIGYVTIALIQSVRIGPTPEAIATHYRGGEDEERFPRSFGQMLEETHFHAFIEGIVLLTLGHLVLATDSSRRLKRTVLIIAFSSTFIDLAAPWLIRYGAAGFAYLQLAAWIGMIFSAFPLLLLPLRAMWWGEENENGGPP